MLSVPFSIDHSRVCLVGFFLFFGLFALNNQLPPLSIVIECGMLAVSGLLFLNCIRILFVSEDILFYTF